MDMLELLRGAVEEVGRCLGLEHPATILAYKWLEIAELEILPAEVCLPMIAQIAEKMEIMP